MNERYIKSSLRKRIAGGTILEIIGIVNLRRNKSDEY